MSNPIKIVLAGLLCIAAAGGAVYLMIVTFDTKPARRSTSDSSADAKPVAEAKFDMPEINIAPLDDSGVGFAQRFTGPIRDPNSLPQLRDAILARGTLGLAVTKAELDRSPAGPQVSREKAAYAAQLLKTIGLLSMYEGKFVDSAKALDQALVLCRSRELPAKDRAEILALRGIVALRRGEVENCIECVGPSSCIFPIVPEAAHKFQEGSREAVKFFTAYLDEWPKDLRVRWALNIAYMTLGEYPDKVPPKYLVPIEPFKSKLDLGRFANVATHVGLTSHHRPNQAGGAIFDDFNGDGLPDLFSSALDADFGASLFLNKGDGTFEDHSDAAGLKDQVYVLNVARADFNNDGALDVLLLRGAWDKPMRMSLLRNKGDGSFDDVTLAAGLAEPISSEAAAWGDYDNDGHVDLFVCGEYIPFGVDPATFEPKSSNRCRLYRNKGDGTFENVAAKVGLADENYGKGAAWGDFDGDKRLDLFVSNMNGPCRLFRQDENGQFHDVASSLGIDARDTFACWAWDFDNDGRLDIFVNGKGVSLAEHVAYVLGKVKHPSNRPYLFRNLGDQGFRDVAVEMGLDLPVTPMGCNFGDIDNDGYLDFYLGTGGMSFSHLVPNVLFKNVGGKSFQDITVSSGAGHLQKGHGAGFADWDDDGDLDLFVEAGGACPGDRSFNLLFQNPGHGRHWLNVKLVGTKTNRAAIGAQIKAIVKGADGTSRTIYRTVGNNSSFGGNSLVELLGLGDAKSVAELRVFWPTSKTTQTFRDIAADQAVAITEGTDSFRVLPRRPLKVPAH